MIGSGLRFIWWQPNGKNYQSLSEVRKELRVDWYRCPIESATLRELSKRSDLQGWFQAGGHLTLFIFTATLSYYFWQLKNWPILVITIFAHGTIGSFLVVLHHMN